MPLFLALISLGFLTPPVAFVGAVSSLPYTIDTAPLIIESYAVHYGIPAAPLIATLSCESGLNPNSVGDFGTSFGVSQIHLPAHKNISKEEALDPFFSIDFAAREFSKGNAKIWSCFKLLYPTGSSSG